MAKTDIAVAELIWNLMTGKTGNVSRTDFFPQKPAFEDAVPARGASAGEDVFPDAFTENSPEIFPEISLPRATPESQGISSVRLARFLKELAAKESTDIHQALVVRNGFVICECGFAPYKRGVWHASYSMCKSIVGMAVGMLVAEEKLKLTDRVTDFFRKRSLRNLLRMRDVTVEHLLTMTSGVSFRETGIIAGNDWVKGFLEAGLDGTPGKDFEYNSMNTYMLSAIVTELTGETLTEYLRPRLWEPLGIRRIFWEVCPMGITKGGWGLFLRPEDAAKLGMLYLQKGRWNGRQLVPAEWVEASCRPSAQAPEVMSTHGYGYQPWMRSREGSFNYNGMLGQNVVAYPDMNLVVVTNAGSHDLFQNCELMGIVKKYFETDFEPPLTLPEDAAGYGLLCRTVEELEGRGGGLAKIRQGGWTDGRSGRNTGSRASFRGPRRLRRSGRGIGETGLEMERGMGRKADCGDIWLRECFLPSLNGRTYEMEQKQAGLMPLLMQVLHNNYTEGIRSIGFEMRGRTLYLRLFEGEEERLLPAGFGQGAETEISFGGELYRISTTAECRRDENGRPVLKLDIAFLEEACRRRLNLYFEGEKAERLEAVWDETPGRDVILEGLDAFLDTEGKGFLMNALKERGGMEVFQILAEHTIRPVCRGRLQADGEAEGCPASDAPA